MKYSGDVPRPASLGRTGPTPGAPVNAVLSPPGDHRRLSEVMLGLDAVFSDI